MTFHAYKRLDAGKKNGTAVKEYITKDGKERDRISKEYKKKKGEKRNG